MFDRLIERITRRAPMAREESSELQLAAAFILVTCMSVDYKYRPEETRAVAGGLHALFGLDRKRCNRLIARAVAARARDSSIFASALMVAKLGTHDFKQRFLETVRHVADADGELHDYEKDLLDRLNSILNRSDESKLRAAA